MRVINDYKCSNGHVREHYLDAEVETTLCSCGAAAYKVMAAPKALLNGTDSGFPGANMRWVREHERRGNPRT